MSLSKNCVFLLTILVVCNVVSAFASDPFADVDVSIDGTVGLNNSGSAVITGQTAPPAASGNQEEIGFVNVNTRLNVRAAPWGRIIGKLYDGDKLNIIGREGDWLKISYNGGIAYVHSHYVEIGSERASRSSENDSVNARRISTGSAGELSEGSLDPSRFGYDRRFQSVFDIVERFCQSNRSYFFGAGHTRNSGYAERTDCSGFVGQFIQKMAEFAGVPPVFPKNSWYPSSQVYKTQHTQKITSSFPPPNPRDAIKPGDVFVMNPGLSGVGHVGLFMGYTPSGQPIIAHSTPSRVKSDTRISGKVGYSGVRIEILPARYASRWAGVYRINNMDAMLDKLGSGS